MCVDSDGVDASDSGSISAKITLLTSPYKIIF